MTETSFELTRVKKECINSYNKEREGDLVLDPGVLFYVHPTAAVIFFQFDKWPVPS